MVEIVQDGDPVLRSVAKNVFPENIPEEHIQTVLKEMKEALDSQEDGVAIAAPQIGYSWRIFLISKRIWIGEQEGGLATHTFSDAPQDHKVFINPRIVKQSGRTAMLDEGCLSVRWKYGKVSRSTQATVEALDEHGKKFSLGSSGLIAQIFQHEIDHLDGVLFIDKAVEVVDLPPEKRI